MLLQFLLNAVPLGDCIPELILKLLVAGLELLYLSVSFLKCLLKFVLLSLKAPNNSFEVGHDLIFNFLCNHFGFLFSLFFRIYHLFELCFYRLYLDLLFIKRGLELIFFLLGAFK